MINIKENLIVFSIDFSLPIYKYLSFAFKKSHLSGFYLSSTYDYF